MWRLHAQTAKQNISHEVMLQASYGTRLAQREDRGSETDARGARDDSRVTARRRRIQSAAPEQPTMSLAADDTEMHIRSISTILSLLCPQGSQGGLLATKPNIDIGRPKVPKLLDDVALLFAIEDIDAVAVTARLLPGETHITVMKDQVQLMAIKPAKS